MILLIEAMGVLQVRDSDSSAPGLLLVGRADPLPRGADLVLRLTLGGLIQRPLTYVLSGHPQQDRNLRGSQTHRSITVQRLQIELEPLESIAVTGRLDEQPAVQLKRLGQVVALADVAEDLRPALEELRRLVGLAEAHLHLRENRHGPRLADAVPAAAAQLQNSWMDFIYFSLD